MLLRQLDMFECGFTCLFSSSQRAAEQTNSRALDNVPPELNLPCSSLLLYSAHGSPVGSSSSYKLEKQACGHKVVGLLPPPPTEKAALASPSLPPLR